MSEERKRKKITYSEFDYQGGRVPSRRPEAGAVLGEGDGLYHWGFDLTEMRPGTWRRVLRELGLPTQARRSCIDRPGLGDFCIWVWGGTDLGLSIGTAGNPFADRPRPVLVPAGREPPERERGEYLSYVGIAGDSRERVVRASEALIASASYIKSSYSPGPQYVQSYDLEEYESVEGGAEPPEREEEYLPYPSVEQRLANELAKMRERRVPDGHGTTRVPELSSVLSHLAGARFVGKTPRPSEHWERWFPSEDDIVLREMSVYAASEGVVPPMGVRKTACRAGGLIGTEEGDYVPAYECFEGNTGQVRCRVAWIPDASPEVDDLWDCAGQADLGGFLVDL